MFYFYVAGVNGFTHICDFCYGKIWLGTSICDGGFISFSDVIVISFFVLFIQVTLNDCVSNTRCLLA